MEIGPFCILGRFFDVTGVAVVVVGAAVVRVVEAPGRLAAARAMELELPMKPVYICVDMREYLSSVKSS